jgi:dihydrofolate reductase
MGKLSFGMLQSLDGYVAGPAGGPQSGGVLSEKAAAELPSPGPITFRHFADHVRSLDGIVYGRSMYEIMRYWEEDKPGWEEVEHDFAQAWRPKLKWVASRSLKSVGPNATLIPTDVVDFVRKLKSERKGNLEVAGPEIARELSAAGLVDEFHLYLQPYVLGAGKPFFAGPLPKLRLVKHEAVGEDVVRLSYAPA